MSKDHSFAYIAPEIYQDPQLLLSLMKSSIGNPDNRDIVFELIPNFPEAYLMASDENAMNLLHLAVESQDVAMVNLLIKTAPDLTSQTNNNEETPLDYALFFYGNMVTEQLQNIIISLNLHHLNHDYNYSSTTAEEIPDRSSNHYELASVSTIENENDNNSLLIFPFDNENQVNTSCITSNSDYPSLNSSFSECSAYDYFRVQDNNIIPQEISNSHIVNNLSFSSSAPIPIPTSGIANNTDNVYVGSIIHDDPSPIYALSIDSKI